MKLIRNVLALLLLLFSFAMSFAADQPLRKTGDIKLDLPSKYTVKIKCDKDGNHYYATSDGRVQKVRADGSLGESFDVASIHFVDDFFVAETGDVYVLGREDIKRPGEVDVFRFSSTAVLQSTTKIKLNGVRSFYPEHIAAFKTGQILITGTSGIRGQHTAFTGVFEADGKLLNSIYEPADEESRLLAERGPNVGNLAVSQGDAVAGPDGNIYLLRSTIPATIYAVSPEGKVIRTLKIDLGEFPLGMKSIQSGLAILSHKDREEIGRSPGGSVNEVDFDGNKIARYLVPVPIDVSTCGCYLGPGKYTFLTVGHIFRMEASPSESARDQAPGKGIR